MTCATQTVFLLLFILLVCVDRSSSLCTEENVEFDGRTYSTTNAKAPEDCQKQCDSSRCNHWTWKGGRCMIKRIADPGKKVPSRGAVSGGKTSAPCTEVVRGVSCHYAENKQPILCLFPFKTLKPGSRTAKVSHTTCMKTTSGHHMC